jgi:ankyrin repeat protein
MTSFNSSIVADTPLFIASERGHFDVVKLLVDHGAVIHKRNPRKKASAQKKKNFFFFIYLYFFNGHVIFVPDGKTSRDVALARGYMDVANFLEERLGIAENKQGISL